ncbi:hypothetical protein C8R45DRAFT_1025143 [Mycena sanguinolenta]|nr:hypothetical protein C8R45DRAFT_1025143 [Mycena sanguinolenta]
MQQPRSLPPPPQTQALRSSTFTPPPLDGTLTIAQIYDWHFKHTPLHRLFVYARADGSIREIHWPEAVQAIYTGAHILRNRFQWIARTGEMPVVAILASSDTIPYFTILMSCFRANYVPFPISPRNSPSAVAHLVAKARVRHLLIGHEPAMLHLADEAIKILRERDSAIDIPDVSNVPLFEDLFVSGSDTSPVASETLPFEYNGPDETACIMHSSGSTAFPKPIFWSNHRILEASLIPFFGERDLTGQILSLHSMPMYHGAACGLALSAFEPKSPPTIPTPENLFTAAKATGSDIIFCVPSFIEAWSRKPEYIQWLATRGGVLYGGGPLNKDVGDYMTSQGVSIFILYGSTEGGIMSPILPGEVGYDWEYFSFPELVTAEMVSYGNNTFELVMVTNKFCRPAVLNTQVGGIDAYATSDLMVPHPVKPGYWKIYGRTDDQIMHNTGEKTNPGPLENILNQDPHLLSSVMFGRGRFQAGVIVDPKPAFKFDPSDSVRLADFRNKIWPTVEKMNKFAPQHSRLFKEMILLPSPNKPFTYTAKMTVRRQAVIADYDDEIATLYETVAETTALNIPPLNAWDQNSILDFVRDAIHNVMAKNVGDDEDIFQHGCDSLQATWIRNCLLGALRDLAQLDTRRDTRNVVYDYPTISRLAHFVFGIASGQHEECASVGGKADVLHDMVAKYVQDFPTHTGQRQLPSPGAKVVLVTGTTGELGCYLLSLLVTDVAVAQVYAINRSSEQLALRDRQAHALVERGLATNILESPKLTLLSGDISKPTFDLPGPVYQQMRQNVTHIIHAAWPVDFNLALPSFEPNIKGLRNLVDFVLGSPFVEPPKLLFTSSIGIFKNNSQNIITETLVDCEQVVRNGYPESKWISEQILAKAADTTLAKPLTIRVGQLSGGINGAWNIQEWVPALVQSAKFIECIPDDKRDVTWIPVHVAAAAIVDFLEVDPSTKIVHLINPHPVSWSTLGNVIAAELGVPLVPYTEWLSRLENASQTQGNSKSFRATRLLYFFQSQNRHMSTEADAFGFPKLDMTNALKGSESLRSSDCEIGEKDVMRWIGYWRRTGLL